MKEKNRHTTREIDLGTCPIHNLVDVKSFLTNRGVYTHYHSPFQEIILARGKLPNKLSLDEAKKFQQHAPRIIKTNDIPKVHGNALFFIYLELMQKWRQVKKKLH